MATKQQETFEKLVKTGFYPLKDMLEYGKLDEQITEHDIDLVMQNIANNLKTWKKWLKHVREHPQRGGD